MLEATPRAAHSKLGTSATSKRSPGHSAWNRSAQLVEKIVLEFDRVSEVGDAWGQPERHRLMSRRFYVFFDTIQQAAAAIGPTISWKVQCDSLP